MADHPGLGGTMGFGGTASALASHLPKIHLQPIPGDLPGEWGSNV